MGGFAIMCVCVCVYLCVCSAVLCRDSTKETFSHTLRKKNLFGQIFLEVGRAENFNIHARPVLCIFLFCFYCVVCSIFFRYFLFKCVTWKERTRKKKGGAYTRFHFTYIPGVKLPVKNPTKFVRLQCTTQTKTGWNLCCYVCIDLFENVCTTWVYTRRESV